MIRHLEAETNIRNRWYLMAQLVLNIPDDKINRLLDALEGLFPIPMDSETGEQLFTRNQWGKECVRRWLVRQDARWQQILVQSACEYTEDNSIVA